MKKSVGRGGVPPRKPLFSLLGTTLIAALLGLPFSIHYLLDTEPYPAIIFPGGAQIATHIADDRATFVVTTLVGFDQGGQGVQMDSTQLLDPIPPSHLSGVARNRFGQDRTPVARVGSHRLDWGFEYSRFVPDEEEREEVRTWLNGKLQDAGLVPDRLVVRYDRIYVDYATGDVLSRETIDELVVL